LERRWKEGGGSGTAVNLRVSIRGTKRSPDARGVIAAW